MAKKSLDTLEAKMAALEALVDKMESGELPLEDALSSFETGSGLIKEIQKILESTEQKILKLTQQNGTERLEEIADDEDF
jgi:exodeoxyribonuclease VII small subunit